MINIPMGPPMMNNNMQSQMMNNNMQSQMMNNRNTKMELTNEGNPFEKKNPNQVPSMMVPPLPVPPPMGFQPMPPPPFPFPMMAGPKLFGSPPAGRNLPTSIKPVIFDCPYPDCCQKFYKTKTLYEHLRTLHRTDFKCPYCNKQNACMANFVSHCRIHSKEKPWCCPVGSCEYRGRTKNHAKCHVIQNHGIQILEQHDAFFMQDRTANSIKLKRKAPRNIAKSLLKRKKLNGHGQMGLRPPFDPMMARFRPPQLITHMNMKPMDVGDGQGPKDQKNNANPLRPPMGMPMPQMRSLPPMLPLVPPQLTKFEMSLKPEKKTPEEAIQNLLNFNPK